MNIDSETTKKIAKLARLHLTDNEINEYSKSFSSILSWVEQLQTINTTDILPLSHPIDDQTQTLRQDQVTEDNVREQALKLTDHNKAGLYLVPKVIE